MNALISTTSAVSADEQAILESIARWRRALDARDVDGLIADYARDAVLYDMGPPYAVRGVDGIRKVWERFLPHLPDRPRNEHRNLSVSVSGDAAFVFGLHRITSADDPDHPVGQSWTRVTVCYRRIDGHWRVVHEHVSQLRDCTTGRPLPITDADIAHAARA